MSRHNKKCYSCGDVIEDWDEPYHSPDNDILCSDCYKTNYQEICPICEEWYDNPAVPTDQYFMLFEQSGEFSELKTGIYHVLHWPVFSSDILGGTFILFEENFELAKQCDIEELLRKEHPTLEKYDDRDYIHNKKAAFVCESCAKKYLGIANQ